MTAKPAVWQMVKEAVQNLGGKASYGAVRDYIWRKYGDVNRKTIDCQIVTCCVNHRSRIYYTQNERPRLAKGKYDLLFRTARGKVELYDRQRHGEWEMRRRPDGDVVVALVGGREFPPRPKKKAADAQAPRKSWAMPTREEFLRGVEEYEKREQREAVYKVADLVVSHFWGDQPQVGAGVAALLVSWNRAFYRFGLFSLDALEKCLEDNADVLTRFRSRDIASLSVSDGDAIERLFGAFLEALRIASGTSKGRRSPVAVAKALHLLAPAFFPPWDNKIANKGYGCYYTYAPAEKYVAFCEITKDIAEVATEYTSRSDKTLVKLIDQYNYCKFTKGWI